MSDPSWPSFLDYLDSDPDRAFREFYQYADVALRDTPPRPMRSMNHDDFEDMLADITLHCVGEDKGFAVLRRYKKMGRSFAAYLYTVANNFVLNRIKSIAARKEVDGNTVLEQIVSEEEDPARKAQINELVDIVLEALKEIDEDCRRLLVLAAEEMKPREIVEFLRLPAGNNKKVSDRISYCREILSNMLHTKGIDIAAELAELGPKKKRGPSKERKSPKEPGG